MKRICVPIVLLMLVVGFVDFNYSTLSQEDAVLALAGTGTFKVGVQTITFVDDTRDSRQLVTEIWYPATLPEGTNSRRPVRDAEPAMDGAPYPVIIYSHGLGQNRTEISSVLQHLASYGFVVAAADHRDGNAWAAVFDRPLDLEFLLDQIASFSEGNLIGMFDNERVGMMGWSMGGLTTVQMGGAAIDSTVWPEWCEGLIWPAMCLNIQFLWNDIVDYRASLDLPAEADDLWSAVTDVRIKAAVALAPAGGPVFGEHGLDSFQVPVLIMSGTEDGSVVYERDVVYLCDHISMVECDLLAFVGEEHMFPVHRSNEEAIEHFATAFFGYHLMGINDYAEYLTADFADQFGGIAWGAYESE